MSDNTVKAHNNVDIYEHKIYQIFDNYVSRLSDDPEESNRMIRNVRYFKGALKSIYKALFKPQSVYDTDNERFVTTVLDYNDYDTLQSLWTIYTDLCYEYGIKPTIMQYCIMTGLNSVTVTNWANDNIDSNNPDYSLGDIFLAQRPQDTDSGSAARALHPTKAKYIKHNLASTWLREQEAGLFDGASSGSVGDIFLLKAVYNYRDNTTIQIDSNTEDERTRQAALTADLVRRLTSSPDSGIHDATSPATPDSVGDYTGRVDIIPPDF